MADEHLTRLLHSLEATFDAGVARSEDEAASDLALSLSQDGSYADALGRGGSVEAVLRTGATAPVVEVGSDYAVCGPGGMVVVPLERAVMRTRASGPAPKAMARSLLELLRQWVRSGALVEIDAGGSSLRGRLLRACSDHVVLATARGSSASRMESVPDREIYVGIRAVEEVRLMTGARA